MSEAFEQGLENLAELRDKGHIDNDEYTTRRRALLDKITNVDSNGKKSRPNSRKSRLSADENVPYTHSSTPKPAIAASFGGGGGAKVAQSRACPHSIVCSQMTMRTHRSVLSWEGSSSICWVTALRICESISRCSFATLRVWLDACRVLGEGLFQDPLGYTMLVISPCHSWKIPTHH